MTGDAVTEFTGDKKLEGIVTKSGKKLPCQIAIVGVGVIPNTMVSHPDLKTEHGFVVNEYGETSLPDVFAVGDATTWPFRGDNIHVEHWEHASNQAKCVVKN